MQFRPRKYLPAGVQYWTRRDTSPLAPNPRSFGYMVLLLSAIGTAHAADKKTTPTPPTPISVSGVKPHVEWLADPARRGRSGESARESANYLRDHFRRLKLRPLFGDSYFQPLPGRTDENKKAPRTIGQNVGAVLPGRKSDEIVILSAHYDHLGVSKNSVYPGADDNASGVALMLEIARHLANRKTPPDRTIAFVGFDLEERLLWGSRWFAANPPWPLERVKLFITADMVGRSLGNLPLPTVFCLGSEHAPQLRTVLDRVGSPRGLEVARLGADLIGTRSDYGPFRDRKVPFLFFSTGEHPDYHTPRDTPEKVDFPKLARITNLVLAILTEVADGRADPEWVDKVQLGLDEPRALHRITSLMMEEERLKGLTDLQKLLVSTTRNKCRQILDAGKITADDRKWLVRASALLLFSVF
ncbi:MAG: M28 family peptidase [Planctomycetota bacterium]|nr:M28 family peptidase [Planctomycetota bacterium]